MSCVITTINHPTKSIEKFHELFGSDLIVVGDTKTPDGWNYKDATYISTAEYRAYAPFNHYARKNLGYIEAIRRNAPFIYSTDDDNTPNDAWKIRSIETEAAKSIGSGWYNVYDPLSHDFIWPRGFSLNHLQKRVAHGENEKVVSSIQQGLADGDPDVDALWRLILFTKHRFERDQSIYLQHGAWCPFNSQATWFFPKAYPLLYLPVYANFRCTDIWGSFVAQRCLWEIGDGVTFHSPSEVYQYRNVHDLMEDFKDEIPGYLKNDTIAKVLGSLKLKSGEENVCQNLLTCYNALCENDILPSMEINSVKEWIKDYEHATRNLD